MSQSPIKAVRKIFIEPVDGFSRPPSLDMSKTRIRQTGNNIHTHNYGHSLQKSTRTALKRNLISFGPLFGLNV